MCHCCCLSLSSVFGVSVSSLAVAGLVSCVGRAIPSVLVRGLRCDRIPLPVGSWSVWGFSGAVRVWLRRGVVAWSWCVCESAWKGRVLKSCHLSLNFRSAALLRSCRVIAARVACGLCSLVTSRESAQVQMRRRGPGVVMAAVRFWRWLWRATRWFSSVRSVRLAACLCRCQRSPGLLRRAVRVVSCRPVAALAFLGLLSCVVGPGAHLLVMLSRAGLSSCRFIRGVRCRLWPCMFAGPYPVRSFLHP